MKAPEAKAPEAKAPKVKARQKRAIEATPRAKSLQLHPIRARLDTAPKRRKKGLFPFPFLPVAAQQHMPNARATFRVFDAQHTQNRKTKPFEPLGEPG